MEFRTMSIEERKKLTVALKDNAKHNTPMHMDPITTGWVPGGDEIDEDEKTIAAIRSIPCHY